MKPVRSAFAGTTRRIRVESIIWDDTSWPSRKQGVSFGLEDENGPVLIELSRGQALRLARHLLAGVK